MNQSRKKNANTAMAKNIELTEYVSDIIH